MKRLALILPLFLCACATTKSPEPIVRTVEVKVPVPISCVPGNVPVEPEYVDSDDALIAAPDVVARYYLLTEGRQQRIARSSVTEPVISGCRE